MTLLVDRIAEDVMVAELQALGTPLTLISEELGELDVAGGGPPFVVLDRIDGSLNASRGIPAFATAVALAEGRTMADVSLGLVRDHGTGEEFVARRGSGAWVDGAPLDARPEPRERLELLMLEGASSSRVARVAQLLDGRVGRLRALGSLALSLCHTRPAAPTPWPAWDAAARSTSPPPSSWRSRQDSSWGCPRSRRGRDAPRSHNPLPGPGRP